jgi:hypothetical protein
MRAGDGTAEPPQMPVSVVTAGDSFGSRDVEAMDRPG